MPNDSEARAFICAAREGRLADAQRILHDTEALDVNYFGGSRLETSLDVAIKFGRVEVVRWLLQQGGRVFNLADYGSLSWGSNGSDSEDELEPSTTTTNLLADLALYEGYKALSVHRLLLRAIPRSGLFIYAIFEGHEAVIKLLIRRGADLNAEGRKNKWTPLMEALSSGKEWIVRILLNAGALVDKSASPDAKCLTGEPTPLMYAASRGLVLSVRLLLERRASVHKVDANHQTALIRAATSDNVQVLTQLLDAGSLINAQLSSGQTALMLAAQENRTFDQKTSRIKSVRLLHERGASLELVDCRNWTALMHAAERGSVDTMMMLLNAGSPVNIESDAGETALTIFAARLRDGASYNEQELVSDVIRLFVERGALIDHTNNQSWTALMIAAYKGNAWLVHVLLEHGASPHIRSDTGETALSLARRSDHAKLISLLMKNDSVALSLHPSSISSTDNWVSLLHAATIGDDATALRLIQAGVPIDKQTSTGETALMRAVWNRCVQVVRRLVEFDANLDLMDDVEWSALLISAHIGELEITQLLVRAGAAINAIGKYGESALMRAASKGRDDIVQFLVKEGANVNLKSLFSATKRPARWTALVYAVHWGFESIVEILIEAGADIDSCSDTDEFEDDSVRISAVTQVTPLICAAMLGHAEIVQLLIRHGAQVNLAKRIGDYLHTALECAMANRRQNVARILMDHDTTVVQHSGYTPLMCAAKFDCHEIVCMLLQDSTSIDETDVFGKTALIYAAESGHQNCARLMLEGGADVNHRSGDGKNALIYAANYSSNEACVLGLLESGADIDAQDDSGYTALINACRHEKEAVVNLLVSWGAATELECPSLKNQTALIVAAERGHTNIVCQLIQAHASIDARVSDGQCALSTAAERGHQNVLNALVDSGACVDCANDKGRTPLMFAAEKGFCEVIRTLLNAGADIDIVDHEQSTAIMLAVLQGQHEAVGLLRDRGASLDTRNKDGWSALMLAADFGDNLVMRELLIVKSLLSESVGYLQAGLPEYDPTSEPVTPSTHSFGCVNPTTVLFDLCNGMLGAHDICRHVCTRLHDIGKQLNTMPKIAQGGPMSYFQRMIDRAHIFLLKYSRNLTVLHLVGSNQIVETCKRIHRQLDPFMLEYNLSADSSIHCSWEQTFNEQVKVYEMHMETLIQMDQSVISEELQQTEAQREVLMLLLFECDARASKYSEQEIALMHRIFQYISSISKLAIDSVPSWFIPPQDVDLDESFISGSYGSIHIGRWKGAKVAVKCAFLHDSHSQEMFMNEVGIWHKLQHPNIIQLYRACHVGNPFFVCELAENGTLSDYLYRAQDLAILWEKLLEAARGLQYLHEDHKVVHGDLKCNNILVGGTRPSGFGPAKLTDFGLSFKVSSKDRDAVTEDVGAIQWKAPEVIEGKTRGSLASDVYSFGMCIVEAVKGGLPWGNLADATVKYKLLKAKQFLSRPNNVNHSQWALISRMCAWKPSDRPDMKQVVDSLEAIVRQQ